MKFLFMYDYIYSNEFLKSINILQNSAFIFIVSKGKLSYSKGKKLHQCHFLALYSDAYLTKTVKYG